MASNALVLSARLFCPPDDGSRRSCDIPTNSTHSRRAPFARIKPAPPYERLATCVGSVTLAETAASPVTSVGGLPADCCLITNDQTHNYFHIRQKAQIFKISTRMAGRVCRTRTRASVSPAVCPTERNPLYDGRVAPEVWSELRLTRGQGGVLAYAQISKVRCG
jgi:hypothetical protein